MIHVGAPAFYQRVQHDLEEAHLQGTTILFEGVSREPFGGRKTLEQRKISVALRKLLYLYPSFAMALGVGMQKEHIHYPEGSIRADMSFPQLIRELEKERADKALLFNLIIATDRKKLQEGVKQSLTLESFTQEKGLWADFVGYLFFRRISPALLHRRNILACSCIGRYAGNMLVHYGNSHLPGMVKLLVRMGWKVIERCDVRWTQ